MKLAEVGQSHLFDHQIERADLCACVQECASNFGGGSLAQVIGIGLERESEEGHFFVPHSPSVERASWATWEACPLFKF